MSVSQQSDTFTGTVDFSLLFCYFPKKKGTFEKVVGALGECLTFSAGWEGDTLVPNDRVGIGWSDENMGIALFEAVTNNVAIYPDVPYQDVKVLMYGKFTHIPNMISKLYQVTGFAAMGAGLLVYIALTVCLCRKSFRKKVDVFPQWLILTVIGCNILMLCAGISYNHISCCHTICQFYLSGVYPMIILFWILALVWELNTLGAYRGCRGLSVVEAETERRSYNTINDKKDISFRKQKAYSWKCPFVINAIVYKYSEPASAVSQNPDGFSNP